MHRMLRISPLAIVATLALSTSLIAIFRSQWIDHERLSFPLVLTLPQVGSN